MEEKELENEILTNKAELTNNVNDEFNKLTDIFEQMLDNIKVDRRIKTYEKETLMYFCEGCKNCLKYRDLKLVNTFVCAIELLTDKYACLRLSLKEIKECLLKIYQ